MTLPLSASRVHTCRAALLQPDRQRSRCRACASRSTSHPVADGANQDEEQRHKEDRQEGCGKHAAEHADANGMSTGRVGGDDQWDHAENTGHRGHDPRADPTLTN